MRILYLDVDTLRSDHVGCYGYHRNTTPAIDSIAREGVRFTKVYLSDAPCLPSRTALFSGRLGIHTGVVDHGGIASEPFLEGPKRSFASVLSRTCWMKRLREAGYSTTTISPFAERHSAWWFCAGFNEIINSGKLGMETADDVEPHITDWLKRNASRDHWFLHLNLWDPHNPYRTPEKFGNPFANDPTPEWLTEEIRSRHWNEAGPECAREAVDFQQVSKQVGLEKNSWRAFPRQPISIDSMKEVRRMFDGYDCGIRYADNLIAKVVAMLKQQGVYEETAIVVSSDHGETLGELNIYGCHMTADEATCHIPLIIRWPGVTDHLANKAFTGLHLHIDAAATITELAGATVPDNWDGKSFAAQLRKGVDEGREFTVSSHMAGACQRAVRFDDYLCIRSYHDGYHLFPDRMLFNIKEDPHMQVDLAPTRPELVAQAMKLLDEWQAEALRTATHAQDPLWTVMQAGGPEHTRGYLPGYLKYLRATGRAEWAEKLERKFPREASA
jgi:arylsulfatase A-like enzyme